MKPAPLYVLEYYQGGRLMETIGLNQPMTRSVMRFRQSELRRTTHKTGELIPVCINFKELKAN